jgi:hypothetical protein
MKYRIKNKNGSIQESLDKTDLTPNIDGWGDIEVIEVKNVDYSIDIYKQQIVQFVDNYIQEIMIQYDYDSKEELPLYSTQEDSVWFEEAKTLKCWVNKVYEWLYLEYIPTISEETLLSNDDIIKQIKFIPNEG